MNSLQSIIYNKQSVRGMKEKIGITGWGAISALGCDSAIIWDNYLREETALCIAGTPSRWQGKIPKDLNDELHTLQIGDKNLLKVDKSVLLAILSAERACRMADWSKQETFGINIGSSRGATSIWEQSFQKLFDKKSRGVSTLTSPLTTLGNISSWVSYFLQNQGPLISHSVTCSTAAHAVLNGINWLESGRSKRFLVGGSEAPLTTFTFEQMQALRIYANSDKKHYPCRALDLDKKENTMVLGEGAACFCLETNPEKALVYIRGIGFANERIQTATSLSKKGECVQKSMEMALEEAGNPTIDVIVCHTPGTKKGDRAEVEAVKQVFGKNIPLLTSNKWKIGHTLGASGALSLELAILMLLHNKFIPVPFIEASTKNNSKSLQHVMVNALGFGGNAVSIILSKY